MTLNCTIEMGGVVRQIVIDGSGERVIDMDGQDFIIKDLPVPRVDFKPVLPKLPKFNGICSSRTRGRIIGLDGDFSIIASDFRIFGRAEERVLKEPDNDVSG